MSTVSGLLAAALMLLGAEPAASTTDDPAAHNEAQAQRLEQQMPLGPRSAKALRLRVTWRTPIDASSITDVYLSGGGLFLVNTSNEVEMVDLHTGRGRWTSFGAGGADLIMNVVHLPEAQRVYVVRSDSILTLSATTGLPLSNTASQASVQPLDWLAATAGVAYDGKYIYGGLSGEVVWQAWQIGVVATAHRIGRRIAVPPVIAGDTVIASAEGGNLAAFDANSGSLKWQYKLLEGASGEPATSSRLVAIASTDQHLRMLNAADGRLRWSRMFATPLRDGPTMIDDGVYQQVPGTGLVKMQALPANAPEGVEVWTAEDVTGSVVGTTGDLLIAWDAASATLQTVSARTGSVDATVPLNQVSHFAIDGNVIVLIGGNSELECLTTAGSN
ncbi:MAG: PQQ-binding-like beta-propeller repeat protein [Phycisphaerales bacterium]|jgi:outer membrane protein assembly factor BamB|nr:PQQ-binding-like beta-propeller repeat protein [Phycisphaerales bacterium]